MTMSASFNASALTTAPAAVNSESGRFDLMPALGSTDISPPSALNLFTVSGEAATRVSDGSISLATAIFIRPPAARGARARANVSLVWIPVLRPECLQFFQTAPPLAARPVRHQVRKIAIRARMMATAAGPYFTSLMKPSQVYPPPSQSFPSPLLHPPSLLPPLTLPTP